MRARSVVLRTMACSGLVVCGLALAGCGGGPPEERLKEAMLAAVPGCNADELSVDRLDDVEADRAPFETSITLKCADEAIDAIRLDDDDEGQARGLEAVRELRKATPLVVRDGRFIANVEGDPTEQAKRDLFDALKKRGFDPVEDEPASSSALELDEEQKAARDERDVRATLSRFAVATREKDYQALCNIYAAVLVERIRAAGLPCEVALRNGLEDRQNPELDVLAVDVDGDTASAKVRSTAVGEVVSTDMVKNDRWRLASLSSAE